MRVCVAVVVLLASVVLGNPCREACAFKVCCWARVLAKMSDASHSTCIPFRGWIFFFSLGVGFSRKRIHRRRWIFPTLCGCAWTYRSGNTRQEPCWEHERGPEWQR